MRKRILTAILFLLCAACCAIGVAACKSDDKKSGQYTCTVHNWGDWIETPATCEDDGIRQRVCLSCGAYDRTVLQATGHDWGEWEEDKATCDDDGLRYRECNSCHKLDKVVVRKKGHAYDMNNIVWLWEDNESARAKLVCMNDSNHTLYIKADVSAETTVQPNFEDDGEITFTAAITYNKAVYRTQKTEIVPKLNPPYTTGLSYNEVKSGGNVTGYSVAGIGNATETEITIPETYNSKPVTTVAPRAFYGKNITKLSLPSSVSSIGENAFANCAQLSDITLPDSIRSIGTDAFNGTAYYNNPANWEDSVLYIDHHLISAKADIAGAVNVKQGTLCIAEYAFRSCLSLTGISIPESVLAIAYNSIYGCTEIEHITVDSNNSKYCGAGDCLIEIHTKILIIGCKNSVIPTDGSVETIYDWAFAEICGLTAMTIPDTVTSIGIYAYAGCKMLSEVEFGNGLISIGAYAFYGCTSLKNLALPSKVNEIGIRAFYGCAALESISVASGNTTFGGSGNCLIETATKTLVLGCNNSVIPADGSVEVIGESSFVNCDLITEITIPDSVKIVCEDVFNGCLALREVKIGNGVTYIGKYAFSGCKVLNSVIFDTPEGWTWHRTESGAGTTIDFSNSSAAAIQLKAYSYIYKRI